MVARRAAELGIETIVQGREDKLAALGEICADRGVDLQQCAYMGDDLPDLAAILAAGLGLTVADAVPAVVDAADWQASRRGGDGAVREACEAILEARGQRQVLEDDYR